MRVPLRPCLPALHYRHLHRPFTLYAELIRFPIYGRYRRQAFDLQVSLLEVLRAQTELQAERGGLQTLAVRVGVGPLQELHVDLIEEKRGRVVHNTRVCVCVYIFPRHGRLGRRGGDRAGKYLQGTIPRPIVDRLILFAVNSHFFLSSLARSLAHGSHLIFR